MEKEGKFNLLSVLISRRFFHLTGHRDNFKKDVGVFLSNKGVEV